MSSFFQSLLTFVLLYKYAAIFLVTFFGALALPVPSNTIVTASSFFAVQGYLNLTGVFLAGIAGNITGDCLGYWLARKYGLTFFRKIGLKQVLSSDRYQMMQERVQRHPALVVLSTRFISALTPIANIVAGLVRVSFRTFFLIECLGASLAVALACATGFIFGDNWQTIQDLIGKGGAIVFVVLLLMLFSARKIRARRQKTQKL